MLAAVSQEEHDLRRTIEVGLMRWDKRQCSDQLFVNLMRVPSTEQDFQVEDATARDLTLALEIEELARDGWIAEARVDAVVQQVGQSAHAWLSTSSFVSSIPPS
jgi:hypothetical protein